MGTGEKILASVWLIYFLGLFVSWNLLPYLKEEHKKGETGEMLSKLYIFWGLPIFLFCSDYFNEKIKKKMAGGDE